MTDLAFTFDPDRHEYRLNGTVIEHITQVTDQFLPTEWFTGEARDRGSFVHETLKAWWEHKMIRAPVEYEGYIEAFEAFTLDHSVEPLLVEEPLLNPVERWAGTPDLYALVDRISALIEIKTGPDHPAHHLQTAAQKELMRVNSIFGVRKRYGLQLNTDGTYKLHPHTDPNDLNIFRSALAVMRWRKRHNLEK